MIKLSRYLVEAPWEFYGLVIALVAIAILSSMYVSYKRYAGILLNPIDIIKIGGLYTVERFFTEEAIVPSMHVYQLYRVRGKELIREKKLITISGEKLEFSGRPLRSNLGVYKATFSEGIITMVLEC